MTATVTPSGAAPAATGGGHIKFGWILRSEWTKLRTVRSTYWTLLVTVVAFIGISAGICASVAYGNRHGGPAIIDPTSLSLAGLFLGQLSLGVLGVLVMSSEYSTGMIRATFSAVPFRARVLAAKAIVFGAVSFVVSVVAAFISFFVGQAILAGNVPSATLGEPGVVRAVVGAALYLAVVGLLALGLGALIRHTAGGIAVLVGLLLVLPGITAALPQSWQNVLDKALPSNAGGSVFAVHTRAHFLGPWAGFGVLCAWAAAALVLAAVITARRDA
jgi:ABC-2 type transport system permease protein